MTRLILMIAFSALGCSASQGPPPEDMVGSNNMFGDLAGVDLIGLDLTGLNPADLSGFGAYPAGPYGNKLGDTFPPLQWEGYVASAGDVLVNTLPYVNYAMDDARRSGKAYAMVHESAFY